MNFWQTKEAINVLIILNSILIVLGICFFTMVMIKFKKFHFLLKKGEDKELREILLNIAEDTKKLAENLDNLEVRFSENEKKELKHLQRCEVVRFQAFENMGGNQSFALALIDATGHGAVISSIFGREEARVYCKPIIDGSSEYQLTEEEEEALKLAMVEKPKRKRAAKKTK